MNKPLTHADVARLPKGTTVTNLHTGYEHDKAGNAILSKPTFCPNRARRREAMFMTRRKSMSGKRFKEQRVPLYIYSDDNRFFTGKFKTIYHLIVKE